MITTTVYYASNNEKQPNCFQLVIGSCSYELPKIEIYEILECVASAYGYQKEPFIEEQTECFVKGNRCIHVSQQAMTFSNGKTMPESRRSLSRSKSYFIEYF